GLRRQRRAHSAPRRTQFLCPGPALGRLPDGGSGPVGGLCEPVMTTRRLVMLRHGQTDFNLGSRMQGQLDTELTELGRTQAVAAAEALAKHHPLLVGSSGLGRASPTA